MILDHIIVHTPHDAVRAAALQKQKATLADVLLIAESFESTTKTVAAIKESSYERQINAVNKNNRQTYKENKIQNKFKSCSGCFSTHKRENCKFRHATCNKCGKKGHISPVCMSANINNNIKKKSRSSGQHKNNIDVIETIFDVTGVITSKD